jgi:predicted HNH restriction endonuclease
MAARRTKIAATRKVIGRVRCEACCFDFEITYGQRGRDFV